ncbi:MAG: tetratricopeptide repeat protein [Flavobacteriales bacterium]
MAAVRLCAQSPINIAKEHYSAGRYEQAIQAATVAIGGETSAEAYFCRANARHKLDLFSEALDDYDRARMNGYSNDELYLNRGICKVSLKMYDLARLDLMHYLEYNNQDARPYYWLATIDYMNLENKPSLRYLEEALAIDSTYADAYYLRAANMVELKKNNIAIDDFQMALQYDSKMHRAKFHMAVLLTEMGQYDHALELLSELRLESIDFISEVLYYRGEVFYYLHDFDGACKDWKASADMGDKDAQQNHKRVCADKRKMKKKKIQFEF